MTSLSNDLTNRSGPEYEVGRDPRIRAAVLQPGGGLCPREVPSGSLTTAVGRPAPWSDLPNRHRHGGKPCQSSAPFLTIHSRSFPTVRTSGLATSTAAIPRTASPRAHCSNWNIATNKLSKVLNNAALGASEMTSDGTYRWCLRGIGGPMTRMNIATGSSSTNNSLATAGEGVITSDKNYVWVGGARLLRISKATNKIKVIDPSRLTDINQLVATGTHLWVQWGNRHLVDFDIATGAIKSFYNPKFEFNYGLATNGHDDVWMTDSYDRTILQFDATTGKVTEINSPLYSKLDTSSHLFAITSEGKHLWVTMDCEKLVNGMIATACGTVLRITP